MPTPYKFNWDITITPAENDTDFLLTVIVDRPQEGDTTVVKPDGTIVSNPITNLNLGKGSTLRGRTFAINSVVADFDPNSDQAKVHFILNGHKLDFSENVNAATGTMTYKIKINFH
jgi:hypothetical protein